MSYQSSDPPYKNVQYKKHTKKKMLLLVQEEWNKRHHGKKIDF